MDLRERIIRYQEHIVDGVEYLRSLIALNNLDHLFDVLTEIIGSENREDVFFAMLFVQDAVLFKANEAFIAHVYQSRVIRAIEENLFKSDHNIRDNSIHTLGKLCAVKSVPVLQKTLETYKESDPLMLPGLVFEIRWLTKEDSRILIKPLITSQYYFTRWAALEIIFRTRYDTEGEQFEHKRCDIRTFLQDSNEFIRTEADYIHKQLTWITGVDIPESEKRRKRKELRAFEPKITFAHLKTSFCNYMHRNNIADYSLSELEKFLIDLSNKKEN
jgi:hypothetical protein